jgi:hypothetical protein
MRTLATLLHAFSALCLSLNLLVFSQARAVAETRSTQLRFASVCDLTHDNVSLSLPADINAHGGRPLVAPIADHPTFVLLSVGIQNYTCLSNGTYLYAPPTTLS